MRLVLSVRDVRKEDRPTVGGKAFALALMSQRNMAVPPALCVTTEAYDAYLASSGLRERILMELNRKAFKDMRWEELWDAALRIENLFLKTPLPPELYETLYTSIEDTFRDKAVVARSSALGEDSPQRSFAGLHESYVNVKGGEAILDHVRRVWASLWSDRALLYRQELDLKTDRSAMAVVIQEMIDGERSGVVFGKNPNDGSQVIIEAVYGLNQGLVDGTVTPDRWILDRDSGRLMAHVPADRGRIMVSASGGIRLSDLSGDRSDHPPLDSGGIERVFELVHQAETLFGGPQDVEWTISDDVLYVLQSRPVTSAASGADDDKRSWYLSLKKSFETLKALRKKIEEDLIPRMERDAQALGRIDPARLSDVELAREIEARSTLYRQWERTYEEEFIPMAHGIRLFGQVYNSMVRPSDPYEFMTLLGATEMVSLKRNQMLESLAGMIREDGDLHAHLKRGAPATDYKDFSKMLTEFIERFGDLSCGTDQCVSGEDAIVRLLMQMARRPAGRRVASQGDLEGLKENFVARFPGDQQSHAEALLDLGRASYRLRDDDNIYLGRIRGQLDRAVSEGRRRMAKAGHANELAEVLKAYGSDSQTAGSAVAEKAGDRFRVRQIMGQPAGPGIASGRAQVIGDASELIGFEAGGILVCDALDPTMTFVIPLCEGIVERRGGMLIHGAIIAREYGLACVTGVPEAASVIKTGDRITVDGFLGIVTVHGDNENE